MFIEQIYDFEEIILFILNLIVFQPQTKTRSKIEMATGQGGFLILDPQECGPKWAEIFLKMHLKV